MARRKQWEDLGLLLVIGVIAGKVLQAKMGGIDPPALINPTPPQTYTTPSGGPFQAGGLGYSPYAGYSGRGEQPGSQTGAFHG